jgi:hypothetical protein
MQRNLLCNIKLNVKLFFEITVCIYNNSGSHQYLFNVLETVIHLLVLLFIYFLHWLTKLFIYSPIKRIFLLYNNILNYINKTNNCNKYDAYNNSRAHIFFNHVKIVYWYLSTLLSYKFTVIYCLLYLLVIRFFKFCLMQRMRNY